VKNQSDILLPHAAILELTFKCNHQCIFCCCPWEAPNNDYPIQEELNIDNWKQIVDYLCINNVRSIVFSGGEPLTNPGLEDLILHIATKRTKEGVRIRPYIISNGALLNESWLKLFAETQATLALSLPGIKTYEYHTKFDYANHVLKWMKRTSSAGIYTVANVTATRKNLFELYETVGLALLHGADFVLLNRFLPGGRGLKYSDDLKLSKKETLEAFRKVNEALRDGRRYGGVGTEVPKCALLGEEFERLTISTRCAAGHDLFVIDPAGKIRVCNHSPVSLGHWTQLEDIVKSPYWLQFANKNYHPEICSNCSHTSICDAGCREAAHIILGSINAPDWIMPINEKF
jgi:radical SAM protein with 4Fe4S-binding SPASM domain